MNKEIKDVIVITPDIHGDQRGTFQETYRRSWFPLGHEMVQTSRSDKKAGALVGMHYHLHQADYWMVMSGTAQVVLHDLRGESPTHGLTWTTTMGEDNPIGLFIPPGVAHGFACLSDVVLVYQVDNYYNPSDELGFAWNDPALAGIWKIDRPEISARDETNPPLDRVTVRPFGNPRT